MVDRNLFSEFLSIYTFQPATAFWRAVEVDVFRKYLPASGTILDLGCGDGKLTVILFGEKERTGRTIVGIDGDEDETTQAARYSLYSRVHTCWASDIPEPPNSFDYVISNSVLEHISDIEPTISEIARLLKPGGTFIFTVPSTCFHECLRGPLLPGFAREAYLQQMDQRLAHFRYWNMDEWQEILERHGLTVDQHMEYLSLSETRRWETISRFTAGILFTLSGKKNRPIEVQKKLGLRQIQNELKMPLFIARFFARLLSMSLNKLTKKNSCLLIQAIKQ